MDIRGCHEYEGIQIIGNIFDNYLPGYDIMPHEYFCFFGAFLFMLHCKRWSLHRLLQSHLGFGVLTCKHLRRRHEIISHFADSGRASILLDASIVGLSLIGNEIGGGLGEGEVGSGRERAGGRLLSKTIRVMSC